MPEYSEQGTDGAGRRTMQAWVRILTNYRKTDTDDKQENDLNHILKGVLGLQLHGGEGNVCLLFLSSFFGAYHRKGLQTAQPRLSLTGHDLCRSLRPDTVLRQEPWWRWQPVGTLDVFVRCGP